MPDTSVLTISGMDVPPYAIRGAKQTLTPIRQSQNMRRTVNGLLVDISNEDFRKYESVISCSDQQPPAFDGYWPGMTVTVGCIVELSYKTIGGSPSRTVVSGSSRTESGFTFYRPQLTMMILDFDQNEDEYGQIISWRLTLEEI